MVRIKEEAEGNKAIISFDTRFDKEITNEELCLKNAETIPSFFKEDVLPYFLEAVLNGIAKDIFELRIKESK